MKNKIILSVLLLALILIFATGCAQEQTPYEINNSEGYTVSVKYDANGGTFTTNTSVIVDSYNLTELPVSDGKAQIALLSPDAAIRGNDAFTAIKNGHFLAGWYTERMETTDSEGNTTYTYSGLWDFETSRVEVDPNGAYTAEEPVLTLYAAWIPLFEVEFYDRSTGEYLDSYTFNPLTENEILMPAWNDETGAIEMYKFPKKSGFTFENAYYDAEGTQKVETAALSHSGVIDADTGTVENHCMKVYLDWTEGEWYRIYNVEQFLDNASVNGNYEIYADLDFEGKVWPTSLMYGNFSGVIQGNGHTFKNIRSEQTNNSKVNAGLFGHLTENAQIADLTFENVTFTIKSGTRVAGTCYGLLAGTISGEAKITNVNIVSGQLQIHSDCSFGVEDYSIGLLCGMGSADVDVSGITCAAVGDNPESVQITVTDGVVTVEIVTQ